MRLHRPEVRAEAIARYAAGELVKVICADLGVSSRAVYCWLHAASAALRGRDGNPGPRPSARGPRYPAETVAAAVARYRDGESAESVARDLGIGSQAVLRYARAAGVPVRPPHCRIVVTDEAILAVFRELRNVTQTARRLGVSTHAVRQRVLTAGLEMPPRGYPRGRPRSRPLTETEFPSAASIVAEARNEALRQKIADGLQRVLKARDEED